MDFIKWSARYGKNRFYKVLLFFIIFCIFTFFIKSCKVHALTSIDTEIEANVYFQTQYCEVGDSITDTFGNNSFQGNQFNCTKGPSYNFYQYMNNDNNQSVPFLLTAGQLINNMTFELTFNDLQSITSTNRYVVLRAPWLSTTTTNNTNWLSLNNNGYFPISAIKNNSDYTLSPSVSSFVNQPQYCSYEDNSGNVYACGVIFSLYTTLNRDLYFIDIPVGTSFKKITLYFGNSNIQDTYNLYTGVINNDFRSMTATIYKRNPNCNSSYTNFQCYGTNFSQYISESSQNFNIYGSHFFSGAGLVYYYYPPNNPTFTPSSQTQNVFYESSYNNNTKVIYDYGSFSQEIKDYYNNLIHNIQEEINPSISDNWFDTSLGGFTNSDEANSFVTLFNSLIHYPLQKFRQQNQEKLTWTNINGTELLSDHICRGSGIAGDFGTGLELSWHGATFKFPCVHKDIYAKMYNEDYSFYPPTLNGASIVGGNNNNFYSVIKIIIDGILIYYMFISCLDIYKYILDSDRKEIEVLDL